ncbi:MFS transporter [Desulfoluna sp.]|uniref:MFS transporter n=1 Tax=Desulfoluna sp. TaxID=2045199 RepID=UPI002622D4D2|nr:MFS transporter [Desulfoluna sp.]
MQGTDHGVACLEPGRELDMAASQGATLFVVCAAQFLTPFMMSAVGVALPAIGREYSASAFQLGLVETVFILAVSLALFPAGRLGDIYGRKRVFTQGIVLFSGATLAAVFAGCVELFILARFFQGLGAAMITGTSLAILSSVFPEEKRGRAMGVVVGCVYLGVSAGPVIGGGLVTWMGWRWIFYGAFGVGGLALLLTVLTLKGEWADSAGEAFDLLGSVLYMVSLSFVIVGSVNQSTGGEYRAMVALGGVGLILFIAYEYKKETPLVDVRLILSDRAFAFSNLATMINYAASFGATFFFSLYLQVVKGVTPQVAGLVLVSQPLLQAFLSPLSGWLSGRIQPAKLATAGMTICAVGLALSSTVHRGTGIGQVAGILAVMGVGFALFAAPNMVTVMGCVEPRHYGLASSLISTMRTTGMLASMTVVTGLVSAQMGQRPITAETAPLFLSCMHEGFLVFCGLSLVGIVCSMVRQKSGVPASST